MLVVLEFTEFQWIIPDTHSMKHNKPRPQLWDGSKASEPSYLKSSVFLQTVALMDDDSSAKLDQLLEAVWKFTATSSEGIPSLLRLLRRRKVDTTRADRARARITELRHLMRKDSAAIDLLDKLETTRTVRPIHVSGPQEALASYLDRHSYLVGRRGNAANPAGQWKGACVAAVNELLPSCIENRFSTIAGLLDACGMNCNRHQARGILKSRDRRQPSS